VEKFLGPLTKVPGFWPPIHSARTPFSLRFFYLQ